MTYEVRFTRSAERQFLALPVPVRKQLDPRIKALARMPKPPGYKKLTGKFDLYRIRAEDYRVIYEIRDEVLLVLIVRIGHRGDVYRNI